MSQTLQLPTCCPSLSPAVTRQVAASFLQRHPDTLALLDYAAAAQLTRVRAPWLLGPIKWDEAQVGSDSEALHCGPMAATAATLSSGGSRASAHGR